MIMYAILQINKSRTCQMNIIFPREYHFFLTLSLSFSVSLFSICLALRWFVPFHSIHSFIWIQNMFECGIAVHIARWLLRNQINTVCHLIRWFVETCKMWHNIASTSTRNAKANEQSANQGEGTGRDETNEYKYKHMLQSSKSSFFFLLSFSLFFRMS